MIKIAAPLRHVNVMQDGKMKVSMTNQNNQLASDFRFDLVGNEWGYKDYRSFLLENIIKLQ